MASPPMRIALTVVTDSVWKEPTQQTLVPDVLYRRHPMPPLPHTDVTMAARLIHNRSALPTVTRDGTSVDKDSVGRA
ncbi:hypothetical protein BaRGS_00018598 [Batillaria attramentaria]|uniref:Uncharacterized protein n=1 Tax=Batillaria attramentaria TaxID=370345 RepID=A0ABD0KSL1_9CAEN